ncbi:MAG: ArsR/SmtB family transcription factor [Haloferacaceae archaeon]
MVDLLPSTPDRSAAEEDDPRVVGLDDEATGDVLAALSSETARDLLAALHEDPDTPSGIAERVDTSLQNAQYHLQRMDDADLLAVVDTVYSEKGREMDVYAPANRPLVVFAGDDGQEEGLRAALSRLLGAVGLLSVGSLLVEYLLRDGAWLPTMAATGGATYQDGGSAVSTEAVPMAGDAGAAGLGLPPGLLFFLGGLLVVVAVLGFRYVRARSA